MRCTGSAVLTVPSVILCGCLQDIRGRWPRCHHRNCTARSLHSEHSSQWYCSHTLGSLQVPLYTADIVEKYVNRGTPRDGSEAPEPHVFLTADSAYKAMARNNASQSLVITGESGSGKTETTKIAMQVCHDLLKELPIVTQCRSAALSCCAPGAVKRESCLSGAVS